MVIGESNRDLWTGVGGICGNGEEKEVLIFIRGAKCMKREGLFKKLEIVFLILTLIRS